MILVPTLDRPVNRHAPHVTFAILSATLLTFIATFIIPPNKVALEMIPARWGFFVDRPFGPGLLTYMFLHGGVFHILMNMIFFTFFGMNVERRIGPAAFAAGYLLCGVAAALGFAATERLLRSPADWQEMASTPLVGASGAVSGVLGMYMFLFPRRRITIAYFAFIAAGAARVAAYWFLLLWFGIEFVSSLVSPAVTQVAHGAHVHGFLAGLLWIFILRALRHRMRAVTESEEEPEYVERFSEFDHLPDAPVQPGAAATSPQEVATRIYRPDPAGAFALIPKRYTPVTPEIERIIRSHLRAAEPPRPHCLATTIRRQTAEAIRRDLAAAGVETLLYPARETLAAPIVIRTHRLVLRDGEAAALDEFDQTHPFAADEVCFLSAGRVGADQFVDVLWRKPLVVLRISPSGGACVDIAGTTARTPAQIAALLREAFPRASVTRGFAALARNEDHASQWFESQQAYAEFLLWAVQLLTTPFFRARSAGASLRSSP